MQNRLLTVIRTVTVLLGLAASSPVCLAQQPTTPPRSDETPVVKTTTNLVTLNVSVTDAQGRFVTGLDAEHFEIYEDNVKQTIEFFSDEDAPVSIGIVFDMSGSMRGRLNRSNVALRKFLDACHDEDEFFLVGFNNQAKLMMDYTPNPERITGAVMLAEARGQTALYDAVYIGVEKLKEGRHGRRALVIISDGQDNSSRYTFREVRQLVREADVQIYAIGIATAFNDTSLDLQGRAILDELARLTGGRAFFPNSQVELQEIITRIAIELRHQYGIGYTPTSLATIPVSLKSNDKQRWRKLKVKLNAPKGLPGLTVTAREGYYATFSSE
ncbi:MAG: VWA domain-containing protein [Chloracidobacterium sp.]